MTDPTPNLDRVVRANAAVWERAKRFAAAMHDAGLVAGEPVGETAVPRVGESEPVGTLRILTLPALVRLCLGRWTRNDRVTLTDFVQPGIRLVDAAWPAKYPEPLRSRLQALLDDPDG